MTNTPKKGPLIFRGAPTRTAKVKHPSKAGEIAKAVGGRVSNVVGGGLGVAGGVLLKAGKTTLNVGKSGYEATKKKLNTRKRKGIAFGVATAIAGLSIGVPLAISSRNAAHDAKEKAAEIARVESLQPLSSIMFDAKVASDGEGILSITLGKDMTENGIRVQKGGKALKPTKTTIADPPEALGQGEYRSSGNLTFTTKEGAILVYNFTAEAGRGDVGKSIKVVATLEQ